MNWNDMYNDKTSPTYQDIRFFINEAEPLWEELTSHIEKSYNVRPVMSYSGCSAQPGWNVKYKKSGRAVCALYPMQDYFIALVVIGNKEEVGVKLLIENNKLSTYTKNLYLNTVAMPMGRWLMIEVKNYETLQDIKELIALRFPRKI